MTIMFHDVCIAATAVLFLLGHIGLCGYTTGLDRTCAFVNVVHVSQLADEVTIKAVSIDVIHVSHNNARIFYNGDCSWAEERITAAQISFIRVWHTTVR